MNHLHFGMRVIVVGLGIALASGCAILTNLKGQGASDGSADTSQVTHDKHGIAIHRISENGDTYRVGPYWGPACESDAVSAPKLRIGRRDMPAAPEGRQPRLDAGVPDQVHRLVCVDQIRSTTIDAGRNSYTELHLRFDDLDFDHYKAALIVLSCGRAESCLARPDRDRMEKRYQVGMSYYYATNLDVGIVARFIAKHDIDDRAQKVFLAELEKAKNGIVAAVAKFPATERDVFVNVPAKIYAERLAYRAKHEALYTRLDEVRSEAKAHSGPAADGTIFALQRLRDEYLAQCGEPSCSYDPLYLAVARDLFFAHMSRKDNLAAAAEAKFLSRRRDDNAKSASELIYLAQYDLVRKHREAAGQLQRARSQGMDASAASAVVGGAEPYDFRGNSFLWRYKDEYIPNYYGMVPNSRSFRLVEGEIRRKVASGDGVQIVFSDVVKQYKKYDCVDTNRISKIDRDGKVHYKQRCKSRGTGINRRAIPPVVVPRAEAKAAKVGDTLHVLAKDGAGRIYVGKRDDNIVQLRGTRVARAR